MIEKKPKVLVIGESCTDIFVYGSSERKSPEGNAPVFKPKYDTYTAGMAANTANNLSAMGIDVDIFSDKGNITKTRYVDANTNELYLRVDENDSVDRIDIYGLPDTTFYDAIVISDYCKGFLTEDDIAQISKLHNLVILDTKKRLGEWCSNITFIKVNRSEYKNNIKNIEKYNLGSKIVATLDKDGAIHNEKTYPAEVAEPIDICGAGDTFVAAFTKEYVISNNVDSAIIFANKAAGEVILQKGVTIYSNSI